MEWVAISAVADGGQGPPLGDRAPRSNLQRSVQQHQHRVIPRFQLGAFGHASHWHPKTFTIAPDVAHSIDTVRASRRHPPVTGMSTAIRAVAAQLAPAAQHPPGPQQKNFLQRTSSARSDQKHVHHSAHKQECHQNPAAADAIGPWRSPAAGSQQSPRKPPINQELERLALGETDVLERCPLVDARRNQHVHPSTLLALPSGIEQGRPFGTHWASVAASESRPDQK